MDIRKLLLAVFFIALFACEAKEGGEGESDDILLKTGKSTPTHIIPGDSEKSAADSTEKDADAEQPAH